MARRYAEDTTVSVAQSQAQVHEFFANTVMPDGQCLIDSAAVQIDKALTGRTILQLPYKGD